MSFRLHDFVVVALAIAAVALPGAARAQTPGYPEKVVQWTVKSGESCEDIAKALYGNASHTRLVQRYNSVACTPGAPLKNGMTLVLPAKVTTLPTAKITSVNPETRARPSGGGWSMAYAGQALGSSSSVNTRSKGRAGIQFRDRTRVYLAEHTLVIIYGSAAQTQVSKSPPPTVKLESGELQAGLAALRGRPVGIDVAGGGRVDAASKDAVVAKKGKRTNVSVFHGNAAVRSAGKSVSVPTNYGTRFWEQKVPEKPRPLPAAPTWTAGSASVALAFDGAGTLSASWTAIPKAATYRVEVSRDAAFTDLVVREHVPAKVLSFRAEKIPAGRYFLRVRAIDVDDFLGIASTVRSTELVGASWLRGQGQVTTDGMEAGRYAILGLAPQPGLLLGLDGKTLDAAPSQLDLRRLAPERITLQRPGSPKTELRVSYVDPRGTLTVRRSGSQVLVELTFAGVEGLDVARVLAPKAQIRVGGKSIAVPLTKISDNAFRGAATAPLSGDADVLVRDDFGRTVAHTAVSLPEPPSPDAPGPALSSPAPPHIGAMVPIFGLSPRTSVLWTSPTASHLGVLGLRFDSVAAPVALQGFAHASGALGPVGLDATVMSPATTEARADSSAMLGLRYRMYRREDGLLELGPSMRVAFPLDDLGPAPRLEPMLAVGGILERWTWLANVGARLRLDGPPEERAFVDAVQGFLLAGGTYDALGWLRFYALLDAHVLTPGAGAKTLGRGGLSFGAEGGEVFFVTVGARVTPWDDVGGGHVAGQLAIGFRER